MFCPDCGKETPEGTRFCASCGSNLAPEEGAGETAAAAAPPPAPPSSVPPPGSPAGFTPAPPPAYMPAEPYQAAARPPSGKKNLAVWIAVLAVLLVGGIAVALIVLFAGGGGTSVEEYQDQVGTIIEGSNTELDELSWEEFDSTGFDQDAVDSFARLSKELEAVLPAFEDALAELEGIEPPDEAAGLHQDILDYYQESVAALKDLEAMSRYVAGMAEASVKLESDMESLTSGSSSASTEQEYLATVDQIIVVMDDFIATVSGLKPPSFMNEFQATLISAVKEMRDIFVELKEAIARGDSAALDELEGKFEKAESAFDSKIDASLREMDKFINELDALDQELQELTDRLDAL